MCDGSFDCPDGSDELCNDRCTPESYEGKYTMKVSFFLTVSCICFLFGDTFWKKN